MGINRGFPTLSQDAVRIASKGSVNVAAAPMARLNAQHERLTAGAPPGAQVRAFRPHEHIVDGAPLGRGTIFSFDVGGTGNGGRFSHTLAAGATWESFLGSSREFAFQAFVTPGLTGTLPAELVVRTYANAVDVRIKNLETGTYCTHATSTTTNSAQHLQLTDIPLVAGQYNRFDIECRGSIADTMDILGLCLYEDTVTHPTSPGTTTYSAL